MLEINRLSSVSSDTESELLRHRLMTDIIIKIDSHLADNLLIFSKEELSVRGGATDHETQLLMGRIGDLFSEALHNRLGALTLLPNASVFEAAAESAEKEFVEGSKEFSMILADIDDLKSLNHNHSYAAGDSVLAEVADRFRNTLADLGYKGSVVFRPGKSKFIHGLRDDKEAGANPALKHDEFVVLLPQPVEKAAKIAKQMSSSVADTPFEFEIPLQGGDYATCSFGMVGSSDVAAEGGKVWRKMLDMCVFQLNAAKRQGGNQIVY
jgi:GGDEF domain-containing protein